MPPARRRRHEQDDAIGLRFAALQGAASDADELVAGGQPDLDRGRLALDDRQVDQREQPYVGIADRDQRS